MAARWRDQRDLLICAVLGVMTLALRYPYMMRLPYGWDSLLYIRALTLFDPVIHQPQPPGYLFYVSVARLAHAWIADPNRALVWVSVLASGIGVAALYLVTRLLYDRLTGVIAALMLQMSVTFWFYGDIAYPYTTLAAASTLVALLALAVRRELLAGAHGVALAALTCGLLTGFRQDLLLFGAPLWIAALWGRPGRVWIAALGAGAVGVMSWLAPTAVLSGGLAPYLHATTRQGGLATGGSGIFKSLAALWFNIDQVTIFLWRGLYLSVFPLAYLLLRWLVGGRRGHDAAHGWVILWFSPPLAFYVVGHIGDYGYTMSVLPGLLALAARGVVLGATDASALAERALGRLVARLREGRARWRGRAQLALAALLAALLVGGNGVLFIHRQAQFSASGIECFDATMQARLAIVRSQFRPAEALIFSSAYYQHVRYLLPNYPAWFYEPGRGPLDTRPMPAGIQALVVFDESIRPADGVTGVASARLPCNGVPFYWIAVQPGDMARFDATSLTLVVQRAGRAPRGHAGPSR